MNKFLDNIFKDLKPKTNKKTYIERNARILITEYHQLAFEVGDINYSINNINQGGIGVDAVLSANEIIEGCLVIGDKKFPVVGKVIYSRKISGLKFMRIGPDAIECLKRYFYIESKAFTIYPLKKENLNKDFNRFELYVGSDCELGIDNSKNQISFYAQIDAIHFENNEQGFIKVGKIANDDEVLKHKGAHVINELSIRERKENLVNLIRFLDAVTLVDQEYLNKIMSMILKNLE